MTITKYDWELVCIQYVQGVENGNGLEFPTLEHLAKEHGIPPSTVRSRAYKEDWSSQRSEFHTSLVQRTREKTLEQLAEKASQFDVEAVNVARAMFITAARKLQQGMKGDDLPLPDQERLLRICDTAHKMGRRALGLSNTSD
jgi:hypothetical protein